jgi:Tfp pilus assembly protein PilO
MAQADLKSQIERCGKTQWMIGVAGGVLALLFCVAGYWPQCVQLKNLQAQIRDKQDELAVNRGQANNLPRVAEEVNRLRARLANLKQLPPEPRLDEFIRDIHTLSLQAQLKRFDYRPGPAKKTDLYFEQPIAFTFQGDFLGVFSFIRQAEDMQRLTRIHSVSLHGDPTSPGEVSVELSMNIYYREAQ